MTRRYLDQRLRLHLLRSVDAIEVHGSLLKAAAALGCTQPALTRSLQEIEDIIGLRLFDRHPRGVTPTAAGHAVGEAARRMLADLRRVDELLDILAEPGLSSLAIGTLPVAAAGVLPGALAGLKASHPGIRVRLQQGRTEDLLPLLAAGDIDLIVGRLYEPAVPDGLLREALWMEPIAILARAGHPLFAAPQVTAEALHDCELMLPTLSQRIGQEIEHLLALLDLAPAAKLRSSSYSLIREMLHSTDMIAVMPSLLMAGDLLRGTLRLAPLPVPAPPRPAGTIQAPGRSLPPAGLAFLAGLRAYVAQLAGHAEAVMTIGDSDGGKNDSPPLPPAV